MKVQELKELLKDMQDDADVIVLGYDDRHDGELTYATVTEFEKSPWHIVLKSTVE